VKLANGTVLKPDGGFKLMPGKGDIMAVYVASGPVPTNGPASPGQYAKATRVAKRASGAAEGATADEDPALRRAIPQNVDGEMATMLPNRNEAALRSNPYLQAVLGLLAHLHANDKDGYTRAICTIDFSPYASFYLLFEPYRADSTFKYLIDSASIKAWRDAPP